MQLESHYAAELDVTINPMKLEILTRLKRVQGLWFPLKKKKLITLPEFRKKCCFHSYHHIVQIESAYYNKFQIDRYDPSLDMQERA